MYPYVIDVVSQIRLKIYILRYIRSQYRVRAKFKTLNLRILNFSEDCNNVNNNIISTQSERNQTKYIKDLARQMYSESFLL